MRNRFQDPEFILKAVKVIAILFVVFALFNEEVLYFLDMLWTVIRTRAPIPPEEINPREIGNHLFAMFLGFLVYYAFLRLFVFFFAQFLLPVQSSSERMTIVRLFSRFLSGGHGPLIFIRDGRMISHYGEAEKKGPGVLLVNSNSAVVVGGKVHGPGIVFTEGRPINAVFDLRKQVRSEGHIRAVTRDGIEIETNVSVQFSISAPPEVIYLTSINDVVHVLELNDQNEVTGFTTDDFEYDEQLEINRVIGYLQDQNFDEVPFSDPERYMNNRFVSNRIQAVFNNQPRRPSDGKKIDWRDLPLTIAIEEFRNTIVRYPYDQLFLQQPTQNTFEVQEFPLNQIRREFSRKVRNTGYLSYRYVQRVDGTPMEVGDRLSEENTLTFNPVYLQSARPLRQSVISVSAVGFGEILPTSDEVKRQTIENLIARWSSEAYRTGVGFDEQAALIRSRAKAQVQQDTVYALAEFLQNSSRARTALILRIFQGLEAATDGSTNKELVSMVNMLGDLREWFLANNDIDP
ncbi:MAG TPA: hypothetical protein VJ965_09270, partial [Anaerolineales bacterium]|nr:hypothetical protein [Anaerolineales bacterium]